MRSTSSVFPDFKQKQKPQVLTVLAVAPFDFHVIYLFIFYSLLLFFTARAHIISFIGSFDAIICLSFVALSRYL